MASWVQCEGISMVAWLRALSMVFGLQREGLSMFAFLLLEDRSMGSEYDLLGLG